MKIRMYPSINEVKGEESGIRRVVEAYYKFFPQYDIEILEDVSKCEIVAVHAGLHDFPKNKAAVAHLHGLYWTADYQAREWEFSLNSRVIKSASEADVITVPSNWVSETIKRDMRVVPLVVPHGINVDEWKFNGVHENYILWNKNRTYDVCNPKVVGELAARFQTKTFISTFPPAPERNNVKVIGVQPHEKMKSIVQHSMVYLSTTKETFGIGTLEAMASGVPVLGYAYGGNLDLVVHGTNGYLATPGDIDDLANGLDYCVKHRATLGANGVELARQFTWEKACEIILQSYEMALEINKKIPFQREVASLK